DGAVVRRPGGGALMRRHPVGAVRTRSPCDLPPHVEKAGPEEASNHGAFSAEILAVAERGSGAGRPSSNSRPPAVAIAPSAAVAPGLMVSNTPRFIVTLPPGLITP